LNVRITNAVAAVGAALLFVLTSGGLCAQQPPPPAVLVQPAELHALAPQSEFIGRAQAIDKVELRARVTGFLGPRKFADGDAVKEGQVLFEIDPAPYQAIVDQREAQRASAEAALTNAELQLKRAQDLLRTNTGTQVTADQRLAEQLQAKAALAEAEAALRDAKINLSYTEIKSPISGRIGRATVSPGNLVSPDSGVLATVVAEQPMYVLFAVTQRELLAARQASQDHEKMTVRVRLADGKLFDEVGTLDFIDVQVNSRTDGQTVRAVFANKDKALTDGQTVRVVIESTDTPAVLAISQSAVALDQTGSYLFVVTPANVVEQRRVKVGQPRDGLVPVESGLKAGENVIVQGQQRVRAGMTVKATVLPPAAGPSSVAPAR
jgi:membrane fusion protein (multidrug efflux system)